GQFLDLCCSQDMIKDEHFVHEALPEKILLKLGPKPPKVEQLRRLLTGGTRGVGHSGSQGAVEIEGIGIVRLVVGQRYMGPGVTEQWARDHDLIEATIADIHHQSILGDLKPTLLTTGIQPEAVIAGGKSKRAEDPIDLPREVRRVDPQGYRPLGRQRQKSQGGADES